MDSPMGLQVDLNLFIRTCCSGLGGQSAFR